MKTKTRSDETGGFTLVEMMVTIAISSVAIAGILSAFIACLRAENRGQTWMRADTKASLLVEQIIQGTAHTTGLRQFNRSDATLASRTSGWTFQDSSTNGYIFNSDTQTLSDLSGNTLAENVVNAAIEPIDNTFKLFIEVQESNGRDEATRSYTTMVQARNF